MKHFFFDNYFAARTTDVVAGGAVTSPWWFPTLQTVSETVALFLPILGAAWLLIQIYGYIKDRVK